MLEHILIYLLSHIFSLCVLMSILHTKEVINTILKKHAKIRVDIGGCFQSAVTGPSKRASWSCRNKFLARRLDRAGGSGCLSWVQSRFCGFAFDYYAKTCGNRTSLIWLRFGLGIIRSAVENRLCGRPWHHNSTLWAPSRPCRKSLTTGFCMRVGYVAPDMNSWHHAKEKYQVWYLFVLMVMINRKDLLRSITPK